MIDSEFVSPYNYTMDPDTQKKFDSIIRKDISAITPSDIVFLKSRISYVSVGDMERFKSLISPVVKEDVVVQITYRELQNQLRAKGIKFKVGMTREQLEALLQ